MAAIVYERDNYAAAFPSIGWCQSNKQEINISKYFCFPSNLVRGSWLWRISWGIKEIRKGEMFWMNNKYVFKKIFSQSLTWTSKFFLTSFIKKCWIDIPSWVMPLQIFLFVFHGVNEYVWRIQNWKAASKPSKDPAWCHRKFHLSLYSCIRNVWWYSLIIIQH